MTFYKYKDKKIIQFLTNNLSIRTELDKIGVTLLESEFYDLNDFVESTKTQFGYHSHDEFKIWNELVRKNIHYHRAPETRMFLTGSGKYHFQLEDGVTIELSIKPGTFISIPENLKHYFNTLEQTEFIRFFKGIPNEVDELTGAI